MRISIEVFITHRLSRQLTRSVVAPRSMKGEQDLVVIHARIERVRIARSEGKCLLQLAVETHECVAQEDINDARLAHDGHEMSQGVLLSASRHAVSSLA